LKAQNGRGENKDDSAAENGKRQAPVYGPELPPKSGIGQILPGTVSLTDVKADGTARLRMVSYDSDATAEDDNEESKKEPLDEGVHVAKVKHFIGPIAPPAEVLRRSEEPGVDTEEGVDEVKDFTLTTDVKNQVDTRPVDDDDDGFNVDDIDLELELALDKRNKVGCY